MKVMVNNMGLDNGIILKSKTRIKLPDYLKVDYFESWDEDAVFGYEYEICYWRKCWNIRAGIFNVLVQNENEDNGHYDVTSHEAKKIAEFLTSYLENPETWEESNGSIWTFDEYKEHILQNIINLHWLSKYLRENTNCYAEFYDSY